MRIGPVTAVLAAYACVGLVCAQELSLDDSEDAAEDVAPLRPASQEGKQERVIARLKETATTAATSREREVAQRRVFEMLKGDAKIDWAIAVRDAKGTSDKMRAEMARWLAGEIRVEFGAWGTQWYRRYCANYPEDVLTRYAKEYYASLDVLYKLLPEDADCVHRHAGACLYRYVTEGDRCDAEKSRELFLRELQLRKNEEKLPDAYAFCAAWWGYVNAVYATAGDKAACEAIHAFLATGARHKVSREHSTNFVELMNDVLVCLEKEPLDSLKLPFHTDSRAFPEPQQAEYFESFAAVSAARIETKGIAEDDPRVRLLKTKYRRYGIAFSDDAKFVICIEVDSRTTIFDDLKDGRRFKEISKGRRYAEKRPEEFRDYMASEGYTLEVSETGAVIKAKTLQGALWGVVSLIQMTDREKKAVRMAKIRDWPDVEKRGYLLTYWGPTAEYTLFQKMNSVTHQHHPCDCDTFEPLRWRLEEEMGRQFHDFGLELFFGMSWMTHCPQVPMSDPRALPYKVAVMKRYAKAHINAYYPLDDMRFPMVASDQKKFGSAAAIDGKHQSAIYREVVKECPDWRMVVCPPFYWGPDGRCNMYPEQRDDYLSQWSKDLDPGIDVYWTGPRVKSYGYEPRHGEWILRAYGRRPYLFQNGMGYHNLLDYGIDGQEWPRYYCAGMLDKVLKGYHINAAIANVSYITTLADALWNIGGYDADRAVRRGSQQLMGEKMYDILSAGYSDLAYFDKWKYGQCGEEVLEEDLADLERREANASRAWKQALAYAKEIGSSVYGSYGRGVEWARRVVARRREMGNVDDRYKALLDEMRMAAQNETHFDERGRGDVYFAPSKLSGGVVSVMYTTHPNTPARKSDHPRITKIIRGRSEEMRLKTISGSFECASFPPDGDYLLCISAIGKHNVRVKVNDHVVFEGVKAFGAYPRFAMQKFKIPSHVLSRTSTFVLENFDKDPFRVAYAVVLTTDRIRRQGPLAQDAAGLDLE